MTGVIFLVLRLAMAVALYTFLVWALLLLWRDIKRQNELLALQQAHPITLLCQTDGGDQSYYFTAPDFTIGRDPACECHLDDKTVSARHARLSYHHAQWWVEDLNSRNGTFLNQRAVVEPVVITSGDQLRCGQVVMTVAIGEKGLSND